MYRPLDIDDFPPEADGLIPMRAIVEGVALRSPAHIHLIRVTDPPWRDPEDSALDYTLDQGGRAWEPEACEFERGKVRGFALRPEADADAVLIPGTTWGDYAGTSYDRAAQADLRSWANPRHLILCEWMYSTSALAVPLDARLDPEEDAGLIDVLLDAFEHGYVPEVETWEVEETIFRECWESYLARDFREEVEARITGGTDAESGLVPTSDDDLRSLLGDAMGALELWPEHEDAVNVYIPNDGITRLAEWVADDLVRPYLPVPPETQDGTLLEGVSPESLGARALGYLTPEGSV